MPDLKIMYVKHFKIIEIADFCDFSNFKLDLLSSKNQSITCVMPTLAEMLVGSLSNNYLLGFIYKLLIN